MKGHVHDGEPFAERKATIFGPVPDCRAATAGPSLALQAIHWNCGPLFNEVRLGSADRSLAFSRDDTENGRDCSRRSIRDLQVVEGDFQPVAAGAIDGEEGVTVDLNRDHHSGGRE
jgi:hypothetical protein